EDGTFVRVGGNEELRVDVRLIAATNRDIVDAIKQHQFREDLFHRLNVVQLCPPPLRERGSDILLLADHFLRVFSTSMGKHIRGSAGMRCATACSVWVFTRATMRKKNSVQPQERTPPHVKSDVFFGGCCR